MPNQKPLHGSLDENGHPTLKIKVYGISEDHSAEFTAMIDTGFTGFLTLPITLAIPLGLTLFGTADSVYADGSTGTNLLALGTIVFGDESLKIAGPIGLTTGNQPLLGMGFLRLSNQALWITSFGYMLYNEELLKEMKKFNNGS